MTYKINLHAHSIFSDGLNSPYVMALKAKELGFSALVITDHFYGHDYPDFMTMDKYTILKKAAREAREILPVILGIEVPFMGEEVLIFGSAAVETILTDGKPTMEKLLQLKTKTGCAVILCHPTGEFDKAAPAVDGFERYNHGIDYFQRAAPKPIDFGVLEKKPQWCNSDAHMAEDLSVGYNITDTKIETETQLIKYIKQGTQPEFFLGTAQANLKVINLFKDL